MRPEIHARMLRQDGLITRAQALECGLPPDVLARLVRTGDLVAIRSGVYAEKALVASLTTKPARWLLEDRAASLRISMPHVASHDFAAAELGLATLYPARRFTHVTRPHVVGSHIRHGVKHHLAPFAEHQVVEIGGRRVLDLARTAIDIAREHGNPAGVVAVDGARRAGIRVSAFDGVLERMQSWPHVTQARAAVALSDPDADSPAETLGRLLVTELGRGRPRSQVGLSAEGRTVWIDLMLDRHCFEIDGLSKYLPTADGGLATSPGISVLREEKRRQDFISGFKLGVSRLVWDDLLGEGRGRALERCGREYIDTCRRFGTAVDDLTPYLARGPRPRPGPGPHPHAA